MIRVSLRFLIIIKNRITLPLTLTNFRLNKHGTGYYPTNTVQDKHGAGYYSTNTVQDLGAGFRILSYSSNWNSHYAIYQTFYIFTIISIIWIKFWINEMSNFISKSYWNSIAMFTKWSSS